MEQASHEVSVEAVRALIAKAHGWLEAGDDDALLGVEDEIFRLCRDLGRRGETSEAIQAVVLDAIDCRIEIGHRRDAQRKVRGMKPEALEKLPAEELDNLVEKLIFGRRPHPGIVRRIRNSWLRSFTRRSANQCIAFLPRQRVPEYSGCYEGMGLIIEKMQGKGYTITIEPSDKVRFVKDGTETVYSLMAWDVNLPRTVAIAAVLAVSRRKR